MNHQSSNTVKALTAFATLGLLLTSCAPSVSDVRKKAFEELQGMSALSANDQSGYKVRIESAPDEGAINSVLEEARSAHATSLEEQTERNKINSELREKIVDREFTAILQYNGGDQYLGKTFLLKSDGSVVMDIDIVRGFEMLHHDRNEIPVRWEINSEDSDGNIRFHFPNGSSETIDFFIEEKDGVEILRSVKGTNLSSIEFSMGEKKG